MVDMGILTVYRTGHAVYTPGSIQIDQTKLLLSQSKHDLCKARMTEAHETHSQTLRLRLATLGEQHHRTGDVRHRIA